MDNISGAELGQSADWLANVNFSPLNSWPHNGDDAAVPTAGYVGLGHTGKILSNRDRRLRRRRHAITSLHTTPLMQSLHSEAKRFIQAASECNREKIIDMLDHGTDPNICDDKGRTALHVAAAKGCTEIVSILLSHGSEPNQLDSIGNTPLHLAACTNHIDVITTLVNAGCQVDEPLSCGVSPIKFVQGRLRLLQGNTSRRAETVKAELKQIIDLMKSLHYRQKISTDVCWSDMASRLYQADTSSDIDAITGLLENITLPS